jgi:hypothetical protein
VPATLLLAAHVAVATALFLSDGHDQIGALLLVVAAVLLWGAALRALARGAGEGSEDRAVRLAWLAAVASAALGFVRPPGVYVERPLGAYHAMTALATALLATYAIDLRGAARLSPAVLVARRAALFATALAMGAWTLAASPHPKIDLFPIHQQAAGALLHGRSIYVPGVLEAYESFQNKLPVDEYTYLPLGALMTTLGYAVTGDARSAQLASVLVGAALLWLAARRGTRGSAPGSPWPDLLAALLLFHPRGAFVLEQTWTEPLALPFLGGVVVAVLGRRFVLASVCLGLLCAVKQHFVLYVPFLAMLEGVGLGGVIIAGGTALATILPFAWRTPYGFYRGIVGLHLGGPFRGDALSIPGELSSAGIVTPSWVGFLGGLAPLFALPRLPRRVAPLLLASVLAFGLFYVLGRQAFCNYYWLLDATALFAAGTLDAPA